MKTSLLMICGLAAALASGGCASGRPRLLGEEKMGLLQVKLEPPRAVTAGARWRPAGESEWQLSEAEIELPVGRHQLEFKQTSGFRLPLEDSVDLAEGANPVHRARYR